MKKGDKLTHPLMGEAEVVQVGGLFSGPSQVKCIIQPKQGTAIAIPKLSKFTLPLLALGIRIKDANGPSSRFD